MPAFAGAIEQKGAPLSTCIGFIDGTIRQIARPVVNQQIMYSGHKRVHCIKFQVRRYCVTMINSLFSVHMYSQLQHPMD